MWRKGWGICKQQLNGGTVTTSLYSILCIVIRLGAVLLFVNTLTDLPFAIAGVQGSPFVPGAQWAVIGISVGLLALAILLWLYPGLLARLATSRSAQESFESPIASNQLQYIAFAVLGVAFAMRGLVDLVGIVLRIGFSAQISEYSISVLSGGGFSLIMPIFRVALGIGLAFGASGLTGWLERLRERGLPPAWPESVPEEKRTPAD